MDKGKLNVHFRMLPDLIKQYGLKVEVSIKRITNICTIYDAMNSMPIAKELLSEIHNMFWLLLRIPVTTSTSERTFFFGFFFFFLGGGGY